MKCSFMLQRYKLWLSCSQSGSAAFGFCLFSLFFSRPLSPLASECASAAAADFLPFAAADQVAWPAAAAPAPAAAAAIAALHPFSAGKKVGESQEEKRKRE